MIMKGFFIPIRLYFFLFRDNQYPYIKCVCLLNLCIKSFI